MIACVPWLWAPDNADLTQRTADVDIPEWRREGQRIHEGTV